jgi:hypothetical protein
LTLILTWKAQAQIHVIPWKSGASAPRKAVILSGATASRSEAVAESKDLYRAYPPAAPQGVSTGGRPILAFFARACPELVEGVGGDAACTLLSVKDPRPAFIHAHRLFGAKLSPWQSCSHCRFCSHRKLRRDRASAQCNCSSCFPNRQGGFPNR